MAIWYSEIDHNELMVSYRVKQTLFCGQSQFQKIEVIDTVTYGRMLIIDDLVMTTEKDEFIYHELITHVPACYHKNPESVLVIGGGDGGTVRELLRYPQIKKVVLCEIDELVIETSKKFLPSIASGFNDPRAEIRVEDGVKYVGNAPSESFDLVIIDSTDPIGPGEGLFTADFYRDVRRILTRDGMMACQSESPWYDGSLLQKIHNNIRQSFDYIQPYIAAIPTYPRGFWSWALASSQACKIGDFSHNLFNQVEPHLKYLNKDLMTAVFALPTFYRQKIKLK